jgi:hypothetical protein
MTASKLTPHALIHYALKSTNHSKTKKHFFKQIKPITKTIYVSKNLLFNQVLDSGKRTDPDCTRHPFIIQKQF